MRAIEKELEREYSRDLETRPYLNKGGKYSHHRNWHLIY